MGTIVFLPRCFKTCILVESHPSGTMQKELNSSLFMSPRFLTLFLSDCPTEKGDAYAQNQKHFGLHDEDRPAHSKPPTASGRPWMVYRGLPKSRRPRHLLGLSLVGYTSIQVVCFGRSNFRIVKKNGGGFGNETSFRKMRLIGKKAIRPNVGWDKLVTSRVFVLSYQPKVPSLF